MFGKRMHRTRGLIERILKVKERSDWTRTRASLLYFLDMLRTLFIPPTRASRARRQKESFETAVARLRLSEEDLLAKEKSLLRLVTLMSIIVIGLMSYMLYQCIYGSLLGVIINTSVIGIALALLFRYHFWYIQIKSRKLGCSLREWIQFGFKERES